MSLWVNIAALGAVCVVMFLLTQPKELREHRLLRIGVSLALVGAALNLGPIITVVVIAFLAFIWANVGSHYASGWVVNFLHRDVSSVTGIKPEYRFAKNHRRDGEIKEAVAAIEHELTKDPKNFEGLMLLAEIHEDLNQPEAALERLDVILRNPEATREQTELARHEKERCQQMLRLRAEAEFFKQQQK